MKYDVLTEFYRLSNGRGVRVATPFDEVIYAFSDGEDITQEERKEIAEYMTSLWKEWAK